MALKSEDGIKYYYGADCPYERAQNVFERSRRLSPFNPKCLKISKDKLRRRQKKEKTLRHTPLF
jgi:hypothetical protein